MGSVVGYVNGYWETIHILKLLFEPLIRTILIWVSRMNKKLVRLKNLLVYLKLGHFKLVMKYQLLCYILHLGNAGYAPVSSEMELRVLEAESRYQTLKILAFWLALELELLIGYN